MRTFLVSAKVAISLIDYTNEIKSVNGKTIRDLAKRDDLESIMAIINVIDGTLMTLEEIYKP